MALLMKVDDSVRYIEHWKKTDGNDQLAIVGTLVAIGKRLLKFERPAEAAAFFESALDIDPAADDAREHHARALKSLSSSELRVKTESPTHKLAGRTLASLHTFGTQLND